MPRSFVRRTCFGKAWKMKRIFKIGNFYHESTKTQKKKPNLLSLYLAHTQK